ncbi:EamA family transporter [Micromonospora sp. WMMD1076]|uniref:EamA family transporter n=1 Tax=Micromonospora sp. WMMD1076 TaxID=3016103 RepID=UPI00249B728A|nr:EamA family transporter [Micromonospora sp. WMMD1076]WFF07480.1 EamA family transporter [Micromonospora sp. WMMD1076]
MRERSGVGLGLALLSAITFATSGTFARPLITGEWSAVAVVIARVGIAALVLAVPAVLALRGRWTVLRRNAGSVVLFGLLGVATAQACFFNAVRYLPVGVALLLEYLGIVLVVGWMWLVHGQRPRLLTVAGSVIALCGLVLVLDLTGAGRLDPVGVLWGLGAGVGLAGYFVIAGRIDAGLPSVVMASGGMAVGALALLLLGGLGALPLAAGTADVTFGGHRVSWLVPIAGLSLIAAVVAYLAGVAGTRLLGARLSSFVGLTEVMFAVLIAWLVLDELPSLIQLAGGVLILGGVALVRADELRGTPSVPETTPAERVLTGDR